MYAIVETGGKQYKLEEGRYVDIELLDAQADEKITFDKVVMLVNGKKSKVGRPYVASATVDGTVVKNDKAKDAIEALQVLGYSRKDIDLAISNIDTKELSVEEIIKQGLKYLGM